MTIAPSNVRRHQNRAMFRPAGMSESDEDYDEMGNEVRRPVRGHLNNIAQPARVDFQAMLFNECTDGNLEGVITAFAGGVMIDQVHANGFNALMNACHLGHVDIAEFLLEQGANPNYRNAQLFTPLMVLSFSYCDNKDNLQKCAKLLIERDASVNIADSHGNTPLMYACKNAHTGVAYEIISKGANLDDKDSQGWTALFWAVYKGYLPLVKMLVEAGARKKIKDHRGRIAYSIAVGRESMREIADLIRPKNYADDDDSGVVADCDANIEEEDVRAEIAELVENLSNINNNDNQAANRQLKKDQQIDLFTFLTITDEELQTLGIKHCWQRRQTLEFVKKYLLQPWTRLGPTAMAVVGAAHNPDSMREKSLTYSNLMTITLDLENRLTVIEASAVALLRQWKTESTPKPGDYGNLPQLIKVCETDAKCIVKELASLIAAIRRMEKSISTPCDMITEKKCSSFPLFKTIIAGSSVCLLLVWSIKKYS